MVTSKDNASYKTWLKLAQKKYRYAEQLFLVEGAHLVSEAAEAGVLVELIVCEDVHFEREEVVKNSPVKTTHLSRPLFEKLASTVTTAGVMGVCRMLKKPISKTNRLLLLDAIQDPGNLGTLLRSALAFGFDGVILSPDTVDVYNPKVVRATQGALFKLAMHQTDLNAYMADLKKQGVLIYAATLTQEAQPLEFLPAAKQLAFVLGNEGAGIRPEIVEACTGSVIIEMAPEVESLNVGVAGSILMHRFKGLTQGDKHEHNS